MKNNMPHLLEKHFDTALESPDGIKKLRELILTLAMQGKLVKQDPKDQPASELLKEIQVEKERLIKEGKIKKQKELSPIKPEEVPYEVPHGWALTRLGEIGEINPRNNFDDNQDAGFVPMLKIFAEYSLKHSFEVRKWADIKKGFTHFADGDIGLAKITPCFENGKSCVFDGLPNKIGAGTTELHIFRNTYSAIYPYFLLLYIKNPRYISEGQKKMTGSAGQKRVPLDYFSSSPFLLPPLAEQKRIVAKIDELMALCDKLEAQRKARNDKRLAVHTAAINSLLTAADKKEFDNSWQFITRHFDPLYSVKENVAELKKAILTLAMQGKLVKQDPKDQPASELLKEIQAEKERLIKEEKIKKQIELPAIKPNEVPYKLPEGWIWTRLGEISSYIQRGKGPQYADLSEHRVISQKCVRWYGIDIEPARFIEDSSIDNYEDIRFLEVNDLLWNSTGTGTIGRACLFPIELAEKKWVVDSHVTVVRCISIESSFLWRFIQSPIVQNEIENSASGTTNQIELNTSTVNQHFFPLPPLAEQKRIVTKIDELMALCDILESQIDHATKKQTALFDAVLAKV